MTCMKGFSRRPLVSLVLCYVLGTWLGMACSVSLPWLIGGAGLFWFVAALGFLSRSSGLVHWISTFSIHLCVVLIAWCAASVHPLNPSGTEMQALAERCGKNIEIIGIVSADPDIKPVSGGKGRVWKFPLRVEKIKCGEDSWRSGGGRIRVLWYGPPRVRLAPSYGERWWISGRAREYSRFNEKRPRAWADRYYLTTNWHKTRTRFLSAGHGWWFAERCYAARKASAEYLSLGIEDYPVAVGLLRALLLGYRGQLPGDAREAFASTGTLHIFAISGLHVGIIALLISFLLSAFRVSRIYWVLFLAPLLVAYTLATGARASAVRACVMAIIYFSAPLLGRRADAFSALAFAALLILAALPTQLFDVGFIMSFVVVTGIILLYPLFERPMRKFWQVDPLRLQPEKKWVTRLRGCGRYVASLIAMSCSAWLVSAPLTAYFFGRFGPIALIGNLLVIPLAFLIVLTGCLSLVLGSCVELFAHIFNHANLALVSVLVRVTKLMAGLPFVSINVSRPPLCAILLWYAVLAAFTLRMRVKAVDSGSD